VLLCVVLYAMLHSTCTLCSMFTSSVSNPPIPLSPYPPIPLSPYSFKINGVYLYVCLVNNVSQLWALYCLVLFYYATKEELAPWRPVGKFLRYLLCTYIHTHIHAHSHTHSHTHTNTHIHTHTHTHSHTHTHTHTVTHANKHTITQSHTSYTHTTHTSYHSYLIPHTTHTSYHSHSYHSHSYLTA
jgi:hypothetical protein